MRKTPITNCIRCAWSALILSLCLWTGMADAEEPQLLWAKQASGAFDSSGPRIVVDASGNSFVICAFNGIARVDAISMTNYLAVDLCLAKYDAAGNLVWAKQAGGSFDLNSASIALDASTNLIISAYCFEPPLSSDAMPGIFLACFDSTGKELWRQFGLGDANCRCMAVNDKGEIFVAGDFTGSGARIGSLYLTNSQPSETDLFIAKYAPDGTPAWAASGGGWGADKAFAVGTDTNGNCFVLGGFQSDTAAIGGVVLTNWGNGDVILAKYDASGRASWVRQAGGLFTEEGRSLVVDARGHCYLAGLFQGVASFGDHTIASGTGENSDIFLARIDPEGRWLYASQAGIGCRHQGCRLAIDPKGALYIAADFIGSFNSDWFHLTNATPNVPDLFVSKWTRSGYVQWAKAIGVSSSQGMVDIGVDASGRSFFTGLFRGSASFDGHPLTSKAMGDLFVASLPALTVIVPGGPPSLSAPHKMADGLIELTLTGSDGIGYSIQSSDDLLQWNDIAQVTITNETAVIQGGNSRDRKATFYRARTN